MKKNSCTPINPKKYSCYGLKQIHTRNLITKKIPPARNNCVKGRYYQEIVRIIIFLTLPLICFLRSLNIKCKMGFELAFARQSTQFEYLNG